MKAGRLVLKVVLILTIIEILFILIQAAPRTPRCYNKARHDFARPKMVPIESAIENYKQNTGKLPEKLDDLLNCPSGLEHVWQGPYLRKKDQLYDPWDRPYIYKINQNDPNNYVLISYGNDGRHGGEGYKADIYND